MNRKTFIRFSCFCFLLTFAFSKTCFSKLQLGIDVLQGKKFSFLKGKRVALLTNSGCVDSSGRYTLDIFLESKVFQCQVVLFPEHDGGFSAEKVAALKQGMPQKNDPSKQSAQKKTPNPVGQSKDRKVAVYCTHTIMGCAPKVEWLKDIDVVVIDLPDLGMRYYTYVASALYTMSVAFAASKEVVILDRPNPLGSYIGGPVMDKEYLSFLGPILGEPVYHGMTIAEKANYVKNRGKDFEVRCTCGIKECTHGVFCSAATLKKGKLTVVVVKGWNRKKTLLWHKYEPPNAFHLSPYIQNHSSIYDYAIFSLATLVNSSTIDFIRPCEDFRFKGRHFKSFYSPQMPAANFLARIREHSSALRGIQLKLCTSDANSLGRKIEDLDLTIADFSSSIPALLGLVIMALAQEWVSDCDWEEYEKSLVPTTQPTSSRNNKSEGAPLVGQRSARDLKKLPLAKQKELRKKKWDCQIKSSPKALESLGKCIGDSELVNKLFSGEAINVEYFRNKWSHSATKFYNETKKYYLY